MAIARDTSIDWSATANPSNSQAMTISGTDRFLSVGFYNTGTTTVSSLTYNGTSMTNVDLVQLQLNAQLNQYYLVGPDSGTNNITVTLSGTGNFRGCAGSYTGASQAGGIDASAKIGPTTASSYSQSVTTTVDNCWVVAIASGFSGITAGTGFNQIDSSGTAVLLGDSNGNVTPAGSYSMQITGNPSDNSGMIMASFAPATGGAASNNAIFAFGGF